MNNPKLQAALFTVSKIHTVASELLIQIRAMRDALRGMSEKPTGAFRCLNCDEIVQTCFNGEGDDFYTAYPIGQGYCGKCHSVASDAVYDGLDLPRCPCPECGAQAVRTMAHNETNYLDDTDYLVSVYDCPHCSIRFNLITR